MRKSRSNPKFSQKTALNTCELEKVRLCANVVFAILANEDAISMEIANLKAGVSKFWNPMNAMQFLCGEACYKIIERAPEEEQKKLLTEGVLEDIKKAMEGSYNVWLKYRTKDGKVAAHYEHSVAVQKDKADILSSFASIEAAEKANAHLESAYY